MYLLSRYICIQLISIYKWRDGTGVEPWPEVFKFIALTIRPTNPIKWRVYIQFYTKLLLKAVECHASLLYRAHWSSWHAVDILFIDWLREREGTNYPGTSFPGYELSRVRIFRGTNFPGTNNPGTNLPGANLPGTNLPDTPTNSNAPIRTW